MCPSCLLQAARKCFAGGEGDEASPLCQQWNSREYKGQDFEDIGFPEEGDYYYLGLKKLNRLLRILVVWGYVLFLTLRLYSLF